jgi:hypothetical protein
VARSSVFVGLAALAALAVAVSCSDAATAEPCSSVPPGGCPLSRGVACEDPACEAVYTCSPGNVWTLDHVCPSREAGAPRDAAHDAALDASPTTIAFDASIDAPPGASGGPGCAPLQSPDCPLGLALACASGCCGCEDLFVCDNGGWSYWATCK